MNNEEHKHYPSYDDEEERKKNWEANSKMCERKPLCIHCGEYTKCICTFETCSLCKKSFSNWDTDVEMLEYRGALGCSKCIDEVRESRDHERGEIIEEQRHRDLPLAGLDALGLEASKCDPIMKGIIEAHKKESGRIKKYEKRII